MGWKPLRKDFVSGQKCRRIYDNGHSCPHDLTSDTAVIFLTDAGEEVPLGPTCSKEEALKTGADLSKIPDLTRGDPTPASGSSSGNRRGTNDLESSKDEEKERDDVRVIEYLRLRQEALKGFSGAPYSKFQPYYEKLRETGVLGEDALRHIFNVERKCEGGRLSARHLQRVYAVSCRIERLLAKEEGHDFVSDLLVWLKRYLYLSPAQIKRLNECFQQYLDRPGRPFPPFDPSWSPPGGRSGTLKT